AGGDEGCGGVWGPLLRAKFGPHAKDVSMVWCWGKIFLRFASRPTGLKGLLAKEQLGYLRGSFGRLVDAMAAAVRQRGGTIETRRPVQQVLTANGRVTGVRVADGAGGTEDVAADVVIATVPSQL